MAAKDYELLLRVQADLQQAINGLDKLDGKIGGSAKSAEVLASKGDVATRVMTRLGAAVAALGIAKLAKDYLDAADASSNMAAKIRLVTDSTEQQVATQRKLFALAQQNSSDLDTTVELYVRLAQSSEQLRHNQELLLGTTKAVNQAIVLSGADTGTATGVVRQFAQAMASGVLRGDEFNSIMEGSPRLAKAMADGLGVPVGALRQMAAQGELTAEKVLAALSSQREAIDREFGTLPITIGRATQQVRNSLIQLVGDADSSAGASRELAASIQGLATTLQSPQVKAGFSAVVQGLVDIANYVAKTVGYLHTYENVARDTFTLTRDVNASLDTLYSRRANLETGISLAKYLPGSNLIIAHYKDEIAELDDLIAKRREASDTTALPTLAAPTASAPVSGPVTQRLPDLTVTAPDRAAVDAAKKAAKAAEDLQAANAKLYDTVDALRVQTLSPVAKIWDDYAKAVRAAGDAAGDAIAKGADVAGAQKQVAEAVAYAAKLRDDALKQNADEARKAYEQLRQSLRTPTEVKLEEAIAQIKQLNDALDAGIIQAPEYQQQLERIGQNSVIGAPHYQGVDASVGGAAGELGKNFQAGTDLQEWYAKQIEANEEFRSQDLANETAYQARRIEIERQFAEESAAIATARQELALAVASEGFANLAGVAKAAYGEQSKQYRIAFALSKSFAIAQAAVSLATNVAKASEVGFPYNIPFIIGAIAQGASIAAMIAGANFSGGGESGSAGYAQGGHIRGPGTGTSDSITIRASNGEYMQREAAVRYYGVDFMDRVNNLELPRYATGGLITDQFAGNPQASTSGFSAYPTNPRMPAAANDAAGGAAPSETNVFLVMDKEDLADKLLQTKAGARNIVQHVGDNPRQIQGKWGSGR